MSLHTKLYGNCSSSSANNLFILLLQSKLKYRFLFLWIIFHSTCVFALTCVNFL
uniref:Uncharacterized protein n=1 Tax=Rhizophora mucronata TaxID=61149 RepID=A0A2P2P6Q4_RHIMU